MREVRETCAEPPLRRLPQEGEEEHPLVTRAIGSKSCGRAYHETTRRRTKEGIRAQSSQASLGLRQWQRIAFLSPDGEVDDLRADANVMLALLAQGGEADIDSVPLGVEVRHGLRIVYGHALDGYSAVVPDARVLRRARARHGTSSS